MAEIINLRQARKQKARAEREAAAAENRVKFGRTKAERQKEAGEKELADRRHQTHLIERLERQKTVDAGPWSRDELYDDDP